MHTDGIFRCEVSAEAPSFQTVRKEKEMRVYCKLGDVFYIMKLLIGYYF